MLGLHVGEILRLVRFVEMVAAIVSNLKGPAHSASARTGSASRNANPYAGARTTTHYGLRVVSAASIRPFAAAIASSGNRRHQCEHEGSTW